MAEIERLKESYIKNSLSLIVELSSATIEYDAILKVKIITTVEDM